MTDSLILGGIAIAFILIVYLLIEIFRLKKNFNKTKVDAVQQINLTIKSLETELQQLKVDFEQHLTDVKKK